jgi:hypothetical protein
MRETMVRILHVALSSSREFDPKEPVEGCEQKVQSHRYK